MKNWTDEFKQFIAQKFGGLTAAEFDARFAWVGDLATRAAEILHAENLRTSPPATIYARLRTISLPQGPLRLTQLGRVNDAERIVEALINLCETRGDFAEKYRAAKFPQAGMATLTELLCLARPHRFVIRNAAFTRALARVTPLYTYAALQEMGTAEFTDLCRVLCEILENNAAAPSADYARRYRYLFLYALLTEN